MRRTLVGLTLLAAIAAGACSAEPWSDDYRPYDYPPPAPSAPPPSPLAPRFPTTKQEVAPPPISGGTLLVTRDGTRAVAADPDRDLVFIVAFDDRKVVEVALEAQDEPGRLVEDEHGVVHVVLRRAGAVASIDLTRGVVLERRSVCAAPRGIGHDPAGGRLVIACEDGQLLALGTSPGSAPSLLSALGADLRDVVVAGDRIFVSRFRSARILELTLEGKTISERELLVQAQNMATASATPPPPGSDTMLAWRMIAAPPEDPTPDPIVVHEIGTPGPGGTSPFGYYGAPQPSPACDDFPAIVMPAISRPGLDGFMNVLPAQAVLPVDIATDGRLVAVVAAGNAHTKTLPQLYVAREPQSAVSARLCSERLKTYSLAGEATAVAFRRPGALVVQSRQPATLELVPEGIVIPLSSVDRSDTGHAIFHANSGAGIACASCHGEGGDDGHVWKFVEGARRTPSLRGTLPGTQPYHWNGDIRDVDEIADASMTERMGGPQLDVRQKDALRAWLFALPPPAPSGLVDEERAQRGKAIFERADVGCATCHGGPMLTNSATVDVGTGSPFQVPSLIGVRTHAPYLHDGCAPTLRDRFVPSCGGTRHGETTHLAESELDDLVHYLESL